MLVLSVYKLPYGSVGKVSACIAGDPGLVSGMERSLRRKWQPTPVLLPGKYHGQRSLVGYSPWGHRVRRDLVTKPQPRNTDVSILPARGRKGAQVKTLSELFKN